ncbi:MAG: WecB/TagA/CpsF family glycosyltransferase [Alphaproteobacteria bacterium]|nr:WecB/TagA/CpsF family glycosyltransferase [Alphaproteobacteria bacterium]
MTQSPRSARPEASARVEVFGVDFTPLTIAEAARVIAARPAGEPFDYVVTPNAANIVEMQRRPELLEPVWTGAFLSLLDSSATQLLARLNGVRLPLSPGSDLTAYLFEHGIVAPDEPVAIVGCAAASIESLKARYGLRHVLHHDPPMGFIDDPAAVAQAVAFVAGAHTRFVFIAIGAPQAQRFAWAVRQDGRATGLGFCIGASLNFLTGTEVRAPRWMRTSRLEWLFRTLQQPRRIGRRVVFDCLPIVAVFLRDRMRRSSGRG